MTLLRSVTAALCHSAESNLQKNRSGGSGRSPGDGQRGDDGGTSHDGSCGSRKRWSDSGFILKSTANTLAAEFSVENERTGLKATGRLVELTEECGCPELSLLEEQDRRRLGAQF